MDTVEHAAWIRSSDRLAQARGKVAVNLVAVYKALGGGWENRDPNQMVSEKNRETMSERTSWGDLLKADSIEPVPENDRGSVRLPDF